MKDYNYIIKNIKIYRIIRRYSTILCFLLIATSLISFFYFGFYFNREAIQFIAKLKDKNDISMEKIMINPRIKFENAKDDYYDIKAKKAIHENNNDILLFDVVADGSAANIKAGKVVVTNNGNELTFSDNPVLIIKNSPKFKNNN